jgi:hypothetical protein
MPNTPIKPTADEIAAMAERGEDISQYFTNAGVMKYPTQQVPVEFPPDMLQELEMLAGELHVSLQAVIKTYLRQALDQHYLAKNRGR